MALARTPPERGTNNTERREVRFRALDDDARGERRAYPAQSGWEPAGHPGRAPRQARRRKHAEDAEHQSEPAAGAVERGLQPIDSGRLDLQARARPYAERAFETLYQAIEPEPSLLGFVEDLLWVES